jgi:hypothetical protein
MSDFEQQVVEAEQAPEVHIRGRRIRNPKLRRGIFLLPSLFTTGNLLCGYYASVSTLTGTVLQADPFDHAAKAIGLAILFDSLDGRVARLTGTNTEFGVQFDSLSSRPAFSRSPILAGGSAWPSWFAVRGAWPDLTCREWLPADRSILWGCQPPRLPE